MEKLDFSALEKLNLPPINIEQKDLESVEGQPLLTKDEIEEAKETAIQEVTGIDEFSREKDTEVVYVTDPAPALELDELIV